MPMSVLMSVLMSVRSVLCALCSVPSVRKGSWPLGNREMESALKYAGYTFHMEWGKGCHSGRHMAALLPDALKWVFATDAAPAGVADSRL
jgi:hypothetical protein